MFSPFGFKIEPSNCATCRHNLSYPQHQRPQCPHHPPVEIHHHHHYTPPSAPPSSNYPAAGSYYPPAGGHYPPPVNNYPPGGYYPSPPSYPGFVKSYSWVDSSLGHALPHTAVRGGTDVDGQPMYVGRAHHERDLIPAKIIPGRRCCYVSYNGKEHAKSTYQVLCDARAEWVPDQGGRVHPDAIEGGRTDNGETLYIGRVIHKNSMTIGKIHPSHRTCYIPFDGAEVGYQNYEVLISRKY
ncbi:unnamed protein product [Psylliodes chrysocephalus]|uniref:Uncharacterized protein n=1 Tax=Psylliodes chrysocephalus TaxID=3402493 RepID=A0A9P0GFX2_9CUCU|nr:unnamed protein product [Psylliodes chrysocephala]